MEYLDVKTQHVGALSDQTLYYLVNHCQKVRQIFNHYFSKTSYAKAFNGLTYRCILVFWRRASEDFPECDLLLIFGTSLSVAPFNSMVQKPRRGVPRVYLNKTKPGSAG